VKPVGVTTAGVYGALSANSLGNIKVAAYLVIFSSFYKRLERIGPGCRLDTRAIGVSARTGYKRRNEQGIISLAQQFFLLVNCNHATIPLFRYTEFDQFFAIVAKNRLVSVLISKGIDPGDNNK